MAKRLWAPPLFRAAGVRLEVSGSEHLDPARACLYAANHQSIFDIPALFVALPVPLRFVARADLRGIPFLGWYMSAMGMVFVSTSGRDVVVEFTWVAWRAVAEHPVRSKRAQALACDARGDGYVAPL